MTNDASQNAEPGFVARTAASVTFALGCWLVRKGLRGMRPADEWSMSVKLASILLARGAAVVGYAPTRPTVRATHAPPPLVEMPEVPGVQ